jgi:coenzyme PQQ synthesis protein D (PqqD)
LGRKWPGFEADVVTKSERWRLGLSDTFGNEKLIRSQSVVARVIAGETLIVPIRGKVGVLASIYSFNGTGTLIWKLLESPKTVSQLAVAVATEYDVDPSQAERDLASFVGGGGMNSFAINPYGEIGICAISQ